MYYVTAHNVYFPSEDKHYGNYDDVDEYEQAVIKDVVNRCRMVQADTAFIFFLFGLFLLTSVLVFFQRTNRVKTMV